jgi:hypothetical protein
MSAPTEIVVAEPVSTAAHRRVTWRDHVWLTLHRQRGAIAGVTMFAALLCAMLVGAELWLGGQSKCDPTGACVTFVENDAKKYADGVLRLVTVLPLLIGLFWGVPAVAREFEARTTTLVWSQDVSPRGWLVGRLATLLALTVVVSGAVSLFAERVALRMHAPPPVPEDSAWFSGPASGFESRWNDRLFELLAPLSVAYAVCALFVGVLVGAVVRKVLPSLALAAVALVGARLFVATQWRAVFQDPEKLSYGLREKVEVPSEARIVDEYLADGAANPIDVFATACNPNDLGSRAYYTCLEEAGLGRITAYQPIERLDVFQWIEASVFLGLGAVAAALAVAVVGRRTWT